MVNLAHLQSSEITVKYGTNLSIVGSKFLSKFLSPKLFHSLLCGPPSGLTQPETAIAVTRRYDAVISLSALWLALHRWHMAPSRPSGSIFI